MQTRAEALEEPVREELAGHEGADTRPKRTRYSQSKNTRPCYPFNYENKVYTTHCNHEPRDERQNIELTKHRKGGTEEGGYAPPPSAPSLRKSSQTINKGGTYLTHVNKEILYLYVCTKHRQDRTSGTEQYPYKINLPKYKGKGNKISNRHTMANNTRRLTEEGSIETNPGFDNWEDYDSDPKESTLDEEDLNIGPDPPPDR